MNDMMQGKWKQLKGEVQKQWGKLSDDDIAQIQGNEDILIGKLEEKYGYTKQQARMAVDEWIRENVR